MDMARPEDDLIIERRGPLGILTLNRPKALNALSLVMIQGMDAILKQWADDPGVKAVVVTGAGERAFCAGGDIKAVYYAGSGSAPDLALAKRYFSDEYRLNRTMHHYAKPLVALMNGIVMGGGYGLAGQCRFRVACAASSYAMPEVGIGFFPDVGSAWHLARMPGKSGFCLGLSGMTVGAADMIYTGVATHFAAGLADLPRALGDALAAQPGSDAGQVIDAVLHRYAAVEAGGSLLADNADFIASVFAAETVEAVVAGLQQGIPDFARAVKDTIESRSPVSLKVTWAHLHKALRDRDFDETIGRDFHLVGRFIRRADYYEGIRAAVIDRDRQPQWRPGSLQEVDDVTVAAFFNGDGAVLAETAA